MSSRLIPNRIPSARCQSRSGRGVRSAFVIFDWISARVSTEGELRWGGIALLRSGVETVRLDFPPTSLRALRVTLTRGDPVFDWSVHELTLFAE